MKSVKKDWIIGIGGTEVDDVLVYKFTGTEYQAKCKLLQMLKNDIANDKDGYDYGTETVSEVDVQSDGRLYAYSVYSDYHIDYSATPVEILQAA